MRDFGDLTTSDVKEAIDEWVFSERDRSILKRRLIDHITFEQLAEEFKLSVRQTKNIVYRNELKVFSKLKK